MKKTLFILSFLMLTLNGIGHTESSNTSPCLSISLKEFSEITDSRKQALQCLQVRGLDFQGSDLQDNLKKIESLIETLPNLKVLTLDLHHYPMSQVFIEGLIEVEKNLKSRGYSGFDDLRLCNHTGTTHFGWQLYDDLFDETLIKCQSVGENFRMDFNTAGGSARFGFKKDLKVILRPMLSANVLNASSWHGHRAHTHSDLEAQEGAAFEGGIQFRNLFDLIPQIRADIETKAASREDLKQLWLSELDKSVKDIKQTVFNINFNALSQLSRDKMKGLNERLKIDDLGINSLEKDIILLAPYLHFPVTVDDFYKIKSFIHVFSKNEELSPHQFNHFVSITLPFIIDSMLKKLNPFNASSLEAAAAYAWSATEYLTGPRKPYSLQALNKFVVYLKRAQYLLEEKFESMSKDRTVGAHRCPSQIELGSEMCAKVVKRLHQTHFPEKPYEAAYQKHFNDATLKDYLAPVWMTYSRRDITANDGSSSKEYARHDVRAFLSDLYHEKDFEAGPCLYRLYSPERKICSYDMLGRDLFRQKSGV